VLFKEKFRNYFKELNGLNVSITVLALLSSFSGITALSHWLSSLFEQKEIFNIFFAPAPKGV